MKISFQLSAQYGGPRDGKAFEALHMTINRVSDEFDADGGLKAVSVLSIVLRVAGRIEDFGGGSGPERIRYIKSRKELTGDLVFSKTDWQGASEEDVEKRFLDGLRATFEVLIEKAQQLTLLVDEAKVRGEWESLLQRFSELRKACPPRTTLVPR